MSQELEQPFKPTFRQLNSPPCTKCKRTNARQIIQKFGGKSFVLPGVWFCAWCKIVYDSKTETKIEIIVNENGSGIKNKKTKQKKKEPQKESLIYSNGVA